MPYPAITSRRIPYDIDGTVIGSNTTNSYSNGITGWESNAAIVVLNNEDYDTGINQKTTVWLFFPEKVEIEAIHLNVTKHLNASSIGFNSIQGSNDTVNGIDGTWETSTNTGIFLEQSIIPDSYRNKIGIVSFSEPKKVLRILITSSSASYRPSWNMLHIYGRKSAGETPDDILFCDATTGNEFTALTDWGDRPEGTTLIKSFKVKNASTTKIANNVNLQLNHADFLMSLDQVNWVATIDILSIPANGFSSEIFVKNLLNPPPLTLGPKFARVITTVGSFT